MKNVIRQKYFVVLGLLVLFIGIGFIFFSNPGDFQKQSKQESQREKSLIKVTLSDLANNPSSYINKTIQVEGTLKFIGENYWSGKGDYFLKDDGSQIQVMAWAPISVAQCAPSLKGCNPPPIMLDYVDKKLRLNGVLKEFPKKEYINKKWKVVGNYYAISDVSNVTTIP